MRWLVVASLAGCVGDVSSDVTSARDAWNSRAWPALARCVGCHGSQPAIDFLAPGTSDGAYATVFAYQPPIIDVAAPAASLLVTMGDHTGPALGVHEAAQLAAWLEAERDDRVIDVGARVRVGPFKLAVGTPMTVELPIAGATMTIAAEPSELGLYVSRIALQSSGALHVAHPLFVSRPPAPLLDEIDRFDGVDLQLAAGEVAELGSAWFLGFSPNDYLSVYFETLEAP